jgi:hypothetical protein
MLTGSSSFVVAVFSLELEQLLIVAHQIELLAKHEQYEQMK